MYIFIFIHLFVFRDADDVLRFCCFCVLMVPCFFLLFLILCIGPPADAAIIMLFLMLATIISLTRVQMCKKYPENYSHFRKKLILTATAETAT